MKRFFRYKNSLTIKLMLAFMLVAVPPMLIASQVATHMVTSAFNGTVEHWLNEATQFILHSIEETSTDLQAVQALLHTRLIAPEVTFTTEELLGLENMDVDFMLLSDNTGKPIINTGDITRIAGDALYEGSPLRWLTLPTGEKKLAIVLRQQIALPAGETRELMLGSWLTFDVYSTFARRALLDVRIFIPQEGKFEQVYSSAGDEYTIPPEVLKSLKSGADEYFIPDIDWSDKNTNAHFLLKPLRGKTGEVKAILVNSARMVDIEGTAQDETVLFWSFFLAGTIFSGLSGYLFAKHLVGPVKRLNEGVKSIALGNLGYQIPVSGSDEVSELSAGFNSMSEQLKAMQQEKAQSARRDRARMLGEIALGFAHEIRNPLGIIKTSAEVVYGKVSPGIKESKLLRFVIEEVGRIDNLISQFLSFAKPSPPNFAPLSFASLAKDVVYICEAECDRRGIACALRNEAAHDTVSCDSEQMRQALLNLILNAMDAMPQGGSLTLRLYAGQEENSICLDVSDTGEGIPAELLSTIHMPFVTHKKDGLGLGLAKVHAIIEEHGGTVSCESAVGKGTTFTVQLKLV